MLRKKEEPDLSMAELFHYAPALIRVGGRGGGRVGGGQYTLLSNRVSQ